MIKTLLLASAATALLAGAASAADLPRRAAPPPVFTPVPVFTWTGAYFGINAGYAFDASSNGGNQGFVQTGGSPAVLTGAGQDGGAAAGLDEPLVAAVAAGVERVAGVDTEIGAGPGEHRNRGEHRRRRGA